MSTSLAYWVLTLLCVGTSLIWLVVFLSAARGVFSLERLAEVRPEVPDTWPKLSVVVAACNEGATIREALLTLSAQDYPNLQLVVVNDRSTDDTGAIVDAIAASDPRVHAVHVTELPPGWLGKVHALHVATQHASGEWILYTDADVHFEKGALQKAVALAQQRSVDHLVLIPQLRAGSFWHEVTLNAFGVMFLSTLRPKAVHDPNSDAYVGSGAFNLVRRSMLQKTAGFEWLRMEVADDLGLGLVMRQAGGKTQLVLGVAEVSVLWYPSLRAMAHGLEKNLFAVTGQYSAVRAMLRLLPLPLLLLGPALGLLRDPPLLWPMLLVTATLPILAWSLRTIGQRFWPALLTPLGFPVLGYMLLRSMVKCLRIGGIEWRGTRYPMNELRALQRVKL